MPDVNIYFKNGKGTEKKRDFDDGRGIFNEVSNASNRRTRRRKGHRRRVRMGLRQMKWVTRKVEEIIENFPTGGVEPLREYAEGVHRFTTKTFMCWK